MIKLPKYQQDLLDKVRSMPKNKVINISRQAGKSTVIANWARTLEEFAQGYKLEPSVGTVFGQDYFCIKPVGFIWNGIVWTEFENWCIESFGPTPKDGVWTADARWYANDGQFWFRDEKDRTMFVLRWS